MEVGVADVARQLAVTPRRVRGLIEAGRLPARKVSGSWLIEETGLPRAAVGGRPMSPRVAWALIDLLSGDRPEDLSPSELSRLRGRHRRLLDGPGDRGALLRGWLPKRAEARRFRVHAKDIPALLADPRVVPSGISDPRAGLSVHGEAEAYVRATDLGSLVKDYLLFDADRRNLWLHLTDRPVPRPVPLGLVIADLADQDGPREDLRVERLLDEASSGRS